MEKVWVKDSWWASADGVPVWKYNFTDTLTIEN